MHPPKFTPEQHLSDWPDCHLEIRCTCGSVHYPVKLLITKHGDRTFKRLTSVLKCTKCGKRPQKVWLCAGAREFLYGPHPDWCVELVL